jgi:membrane protease subunit (stomatin/prohibitin family)
MSLRSFISKQYIDVIQWTEDQTGVLATRYPMQDMEIQSGAQLTVRESQMAVFINEGRMADVFGPGLYTLTTQNLPVLTDIMNWDKKFESPFKSDVYFFSTRQQTGQKWGTATPITIRDKEFGAVRVRGYGIYAWHVFDPRVFHTKIAGTRDTYLVNDIEEQLKNTIVSHMTDAFAVSSVPFLDMAANQADLARRIGDGMKPVFADLGLMLDSFIVENLSLPDELQKTLDARIGMNMVGDMGRFAQFQAGTSLPIAAGNEGGGGASAGMGLGAGIAMGQQLMNAMRSDSAGSSTSAATVEPPAPNGAAAATKFCINCGKSITRSAKFCPECGSGQQ